MTKRLIIFDAHKVLRLLKVTLMANMNMCTAAGTQDGKP
eukprot:CAMPEP_0118923144 /NCGR_PEP_ID=MMETSP1169-20130426/1779_1 /TAXON_ID=36882 /ORGANISM="Pyramimonas obovata, Strain CCMP722" /LENGTH=38 /DNA_ID= /DNA_START= /DNA_END= /DNA_ORIENTATION=